MMNNQASNSANRWIVIAAIATQLALLFITFPLPAGSDGQGLFHIDHPYHLYQVALGRTLIEYGNFVGYDPFFGGGNLGGVTYNASAKLPILLSLLIPASVPTETLYSYYVFACALIAPAAIVLLGHLLRWTAAQTIIAGLVGLLFWWIGAFRWYHTAGMVSFVCACYISLPYAVWVFRSILTRGGTFPLARVFSAGLLGGLGMWLHPLFGIMAGTILTGFLAANFASLKWSATLSRGSAIALIAVALNLPWIQAISNGSSELLDQPYQKFAGSEFLANAILGVWNQSMGSMLNPLVVVAALITLFVCRCASRREAMIFFGLGSSFIFFAAFGAKLAILSGLQPNRFLAPGFLIIGIAATYAANDYISWLLSKRKYGALKLVSVAIVLLLFATSARELAREAFPGTHGRYGKSPPEITLPPASVAWLASWIKAHTTPDGRILFETSLSRNHGGGHIAGYLALQTKREFIGAPYPFLMPERSFWDQSGFGHPLSELTAERLSAGLELYNVGWVIAHTEELGRHIAALPHARLLAHSEGIRIFGIDRPLSYFQSGEAQVLERDFDRLVVSTKPGTDLVLRYHWIKGVTMTPTAQVEPVSLLPDYPPFIRIVNAPAHFLIHLNR